MNIGVDAMSGDWAPENVILGAIESLALISPKTELILIGDEQVIKKFSREQGYSTPPFKIVHSTEVIEMDDHPVKSFLQKEDSSLVIGFEMLKRGEIDAFASTGSTGAILTGCQVKLSPLPGVMRPSIAVEMPHLNRGNVLFLDLGFNTDTKPDMLYQFALLGSIFAKEMMGIAEPRVALLNVGEEEQKGTMVTREAYKLMRDLSLFNFVGNIEANQLFVEDVADVVVTDGFVGNILLKQAEAMYNLAKELNLEDSFFGSFNYENYGGAPILGIQAPLIIGHGASSPLAVTNMILQAERALKNRLVEKFKESISYEE